jgi:ribose transport system ATP-binding protein
MAGRNRLSFPILEALGRSIELRRDNMVLPDPDVSRAALRVADATKAFGSTKALESVSLELRPGRVLALVGPNGSGKSTLIRALAGYHRLDSGSILVYGSAITARGHEGSALRFVHQDLALLPSLDVADNLAVVQGYVTDRFGTIRWRLERERTRSVLKQVLLDVEPTTNVSDLGPVERTLIAVARALDHVDVGHNILVLDEPTARLPREQAAGLISRLKVLRDRGLPILYVTHRLEEVHELADAALVLKDGRMVFSGLVSEITIENLRSLIAGPKRVTETPSASKARPVSEKTYDDQTLDIRALSSRRLREVSLTVRRGEIVAVTGLIGSGRSELGRVVYGLQLRYAGDILIGGKKAAFPASDALDSSSVGYSPQERRSGLFAHLSLGENLTLASFAGLRAWYGLSRRLFRQAAKRAIELLAIVPEDPGAAIDVLSGGNQQKAALGKWLRLPLRLLILDEPTQSIDVGAKADLMLAIKRKAKEEGLGVLWLESDIEEVVKYADRILVMSDGSITGEFTARPFEVADIWTAAYSLAPEAGSELKRN